MPSFKARLNPNNYSQKLEEYTLKAKLPSLKYLEHHTLTVRHCFFVRFSDSYNILK